MSHIKNEAMNTVRTLFRAVLTGAGLRIGGALGKKGMDEVKDRWKAHKEKKKKKNEDDDGDPIPLPGEIEVMEVEAETDQAREEDKQP